MPKGSGFYYARNYMSVMKRDDQAWKWLNETQLAYDIWDKKYRYNGESFEAWLDRVSGGNETCRKMIVEKKFLPAGRILANRGLYKEGIKLSYSNCYVLQQPDDSIESIFDCAKNLARTFSYGGGCGINLSKLAPRGAKVNNTARETSGAVSFMDLYSMVTGLIGQHGRRGALMISLDCTHPDLEEFIDIKTDLSKVTKANISVMINDEFMQAVEDDTDFTLSFIREETGEKIEKVVKAKEMFHKLCENNWNFAEPGMLFWDTISNYNLLSNNDEFEYAGVNPCSEEPLPAGGSCLLSSINLSEFVIDPFTDNAQIDYDSLEETVTNVVIYLNEVLDEGLPLHPLEIQRDTVRDWRQIGTGIMGLADMLIKLGITYGSGDAIYLCSELSQFIADKALRASANLAAKYGTYPKYDNKVLDTEFIYYNVTETTYKLIERYGLRNSQLLTIAPTGTLSTFLGVSGGGEPIFANSYTRKTESLNGEDTYYKVYTPIVAEYMAANNITNEADLPEYFVTAKDIDPVNRVYMQGALQSGIDASISSTVNLPHEATIEDVENIYMAAWKNRLKGITVYRAGCAREGILVETTKSDQVNDQDTDQVNCEHECNEIPRGYVIDTSDDLIGYKRKLTTGCGNIHMEVYSDEITGEPQETFMNIGSSGGCERNYQFISRLISLALRGGIAIESIIDQAMSVRPCTAYVNRTKSKHDTSPGTSCPSAIGNALRDLKAKMEDRCFSDPSEYTDYVEYATLLPSACNCAECECEHEEAEVSTAPKCTECGEPLQYEGGCIVCKNCGWSKCD